MLKKIISLSLMLMLLSAFMIVVHADAPVMGVSTVEAEPGESVNVTVYIQNNPGVTSAKFYVRKDSTLTLTNYAVGTILKDGSTGTTADDFAKESFAVSLVQEASTSADGTLATLTYTVPNDATPGTTLPLTLEFTRDGKRGSITNGTSYQYQIKKNGTIVNNAGFTFVNGGITVKGTPAPTTYTLTYDAGAGSGAPAAETGITAGTEISLAGKTATAPAGKVFAGWTANGKDIITSIVVNDNVTLKAVYEDEPVAEKLLKGVITRQADSVTITDDTINVVYDLKQNKVNSGYVMFAPAVADGTEVDLGTFNYYSKFPTTEYTLSAASATGIDLAAETGKESVEAYSVLKNAANSQSFTMTLTNGEEVETYTVNLTITDFATTAGDFGITADDIVTYRTGDVVEVSGKNINLTTKNKYNYNTLAIKADGLKLGAVEGRQRPAIEVVNADANIKSVGGGDGNYNEAVLFYYGTGDRSYTLRLYGGEDFLSYEDYTLNITYVSTFGNDLVNIWRVQKVSNATINSTDEINTNNEIVVTSSAAGGDISFYPIIFGDRIGTFTNVGNAAIVKQDFNGREMKMVRVDPSEVPSDMKFIVKYIRDSRTYNVVFNVN